MNKFKFTTTILISVFLLNSCQQSADSGKDVYSSPEILESSADEANDLVGSQNAAPLNSTAADYTHPDKKFVRTADLSMEVKNVYASTNRIESKVSELGGYVTKSDLASNVFSEKTYEVSKDSAVEVRKYTVSNRMTLRIPETELSEFLIALGDEISFLDYRNIQADDVSLQLLLNQMEQQRIENVSEKLNHLTSENGKISEKQQLISDENSKQSELNREKINRMKTEDEIAYSTVSLTIKEKEKAAEIPVINLKDFDDKYKTGFWLSALNSVKGGFDLLQTILIGILYLWPVFVLGSLVWFAIRKYRKSANRIPA
ncbi:MAG: DUF4349 domain-containing protein [Moheibacter sp.]